MKGNFEIFGFTNDYTFRICQFIILSFPVVDFVCVGVGVGVRVFS